MSMHTYDFTSSDSDPVTPIEESIDGDIPDTLDISDTLDIPINNNTYQTIWNKFIKLVNTCTKNLTNESFYNLIDYVELYSNHISTRIIYYQPYLTILDEAKKQNIIEYNYYYKNIDKIQNQIICNSCYSINAKDSIKIKNKGYHSLISPNYDLCEKCYHENNKYLPFIELWY